MSKIFFSWQSDIAQNSTTRAIRRAAAIAATAMTLKFDTLVTVEEATSNSSGSPYIPGELAKKIQASEVFIADITSIVQMANGKSLPNPNVTFELGLAAAHLGWERIILVFNIAAAKFEKLPFDFDRHRISKYSMAEAKKPSEVEQNQLNDLVTIAVETILDQKPLRPRDLEGKSEAEIKHERDVVNLRWFLRHISIDLLGKHVQDMPNMLHYFAVFMSDGLEGVVNSASFNLYDEPLEDLLRSLYRDLKLSLSFDHLYRDSNSQWLQLFGVLGRNRNFEENMKTEAEIRAIILSLAENLREVVSAIRSKYLEIDLDETSAEFSQSYRQMVENVERECDD